MKTAERALLNKLLSDARVEYIEEVAYIMATVKHETANTFLPIREFGRGRRMKYGSIYYGRGYVQLTWLANYKLFSNLLGVDLIDDPNDSTDDGAPDKALDPDLAYEIMIIGMTKGIFTGKKLSDYIDDFHVDYVQARRVVNGTDRARLIAKYALEYETLIL